MKRTVLFLALILSLMGIRAQTRVQLLTCYPGEEFFQLEGHTGLRIIDPQVGDYVVNWGVFDFNTPNFAYRFTKGETDYMAAAFPTDYFLDSYRREGRCVVAQEVNLSEKQTQVLKSLIENNLLPENRVYRYNYVYDNCATRPLALIEKALGDTLSLGKPSFNGKSFRDAMRHYHTNYPWYQFGIDLALGSGIDKPITQREMSFSPVDLEQLLATARHANGEPAISQTMVLTGNRDISTILSPTPWYASPLFVCFFFLFINLLICYHDLRSRKYTRIWDTLMYGIFGLAGCVICFLIFISVHEATSPNYLLLWLNPLCFIAAVGVWVKKAAKLVEWYQMLNFALILALCVVLLWGVQSTNVALYFLMAADATRSLTYLRITKWSIASPRK